MRSVPSNKRSVKDVGEKHQHRRSVLRNKLSVSNMLVKNTNMGGDGMKEVLLATNVVSKMLVKNTNIGATPTWARSVSNLLMKNTNIGVPVQPGDFCV